MMCNYKDALYIHYGTPHFDICRFNRPTYDFKPRGGLWASVYTESETPYWKMWCELNDFGDAKDESCPSFVFRLKDDAKLLIIDYTNIQNIPHTDYWQIMISNKNIQRVDCKKAFNGYDAVYVDLFCVPDFNYKFPMWDVPSLYVLNPNCIEEVDI